MRRLRSRASVIWRLCQFLWQERLWWMIPMVVTLLVFGALVFFAQSSAIAPFVYTLF